MLRPSVNQILKNNESYYSLVIGIAKRAREISENAIKDKVVLDEKPVKTAVAEFANGDYKLVEDPRLKK
ncbi:MAG: DNA-directed RNA polymerase subunit omega [Oscillospiraceae bacterium]|nr:DNA-directed RNA polymerase subunit omega [Oscillospiraceae bacterium]MBQ8379171.1 DNA-directed RNA polymerase subunit omega [Oscillospiraceae bacterium]MBQ8883741.1 DNA-directed RNA polymerase subunit omega [Oscillospiraceae bacterium]